MHTSIVPFLVVALLGAPQWQAPPPDADTASTPDGDGPVEVVLLGVTHFAGSAGDDFTFAIEDILEPHRQEQLAEAARRLAAFEPERAYFECMPEQAGALNDAYAAYRAGDLDPVAEERRNEVYQLGFRMAKEAGLEAVRCADAEGLWLGDQARQVGAQHQPEVVERIQRAGREGIRGSVTFLEDHDLVEFLGFVNSEEELRRRHAQYIERYIQVGTFGDSRLDMRMDSPLAGREVVLAGEFPGYPIHRVQTALETSDVRLREEVTTSTDYVVAGRSSDSAVDRAREVDAAVMEVQEFVAYALADADLYVGFPEGRIGADLVGEWYKRNLRTFANVVNDVGPETKRIFVMFGAGHVWPLRQFFRDHSGFRVVPVEDVL